MTLEFHFLPADVVGLPDWAGSVLAERPRPSRLPGLVVPADVAHIDRPADRLEPEARAALALDLERALVPFQPHVSVLESVRSLRASGTTMVIAGQQPGFLGGPLFNLYKAVHVVVLARALARLWETPVVPAFWNHADDHDVAEFHHLWIQNPNLDLRKVSLAGMSSGRVPLSALHFDQERHRLGALAELLRQNLWQGPELEPALELFLPRAGESFSNAFTRVMLALCGHLGLVVLEPQWIRAQQSRALAGLVACDVEGALAAGASAVRALGREPAIDPAEAALVFRMIEGKRQALRLAHGQFRYDGESGSRSPVELAAEIVQSPDVWSCGALLRPVVQDLVLPTVAYVGGWGELAYHAQLGPLRASAGAPPMPFVPRLSATLVDAAARESLAKLELEVRDVLRARGQFRTETSDAASPAVALRLREVARRAALDLVALREDVAVLDRGLAQHVKRSADQIEDLVDKLAGKLERVQANSAGGEKRHHRRLTNALYPNDAPQERVRGMLEFVARQGTSWVDDLLAGIEPLPTEHLVAFFPS